MDVNKEVKLLQKCKKKSGVGGEVRSCRGWGGGRGVGVGR